MSGGKAGGPPLDIPFIDFEIKPHELKEPGSGEVIYWMWPCITYEEQERHAIATKTLSKRWHGSFARWLKLAIPPFASTNQVRETRSSELPDYARLDHGCRASATHRARPCAPFRDMPRDDTWLRYEFKTRMMGPMTWQDGKLELRVPDGQRLVVRLYRPQQAVLPFGASSHRKPYKGTWESLCIGVNARWSMAEVFVEDDGQVKGRHYGFGGQLDPVAQFLAANM